jgi:CYTH domain-containing protein
MAIEIERKFLVANTQIVAKLKPTRFKQAYLNSNKERTVRIRQQGDAAFITIKSKSTGLSRQEFEYPIPLQDAEELFSLCETVAIEKNRYYLQQEQLCWEIDEFLGENQGLWTAEIELNSEKQDFTRPAWLGDEVSSDPRYFNSALSLKPFSRW